MGGGDDFPKGQRLPLRIITHNIRYAAMDLFEHEKPWPERLPNITRQFQHYTILPFNPPSTIICLQEVLEGQLEDLAANLASIKSGETKETWVHVGVGRDDGKSAGEFNPIFYRAASWERLHFETIWLSDTPEKASRGWDGGSNRLCTCLILQSKHKSVSQKLMVLNTHLDNAGAVARRKGAELMIERTRRWREAFQPDHVVLTGDLNSTKDEVNGAYQTLNAKRSGFVDVGRLLREGNDTRSWGERSTYTGFDGHGDDDEVGVLDFVHYGLKDEDVAKASDKLCSYSVLPNVFEDGIRCSDHRAVLVDLLL